MHNRSQYIDYLIILLLLMIGMWQLVLGQAVMKWDIMDLYLPNNNWVTEALNNARLPLWNPFINSGFSQMGDPATWYPISWLLGFILRYNLNTVHLEFLLHLYLAGIGLYKIGESKNFKRHTRIALAAAYMFSGFFIGNAQHMTWVVSAAWFPWVILYFSRLQSRPGYINCILFALVLFLMLTGGYPGLFISTAYLLSGYLVYYTGVSIRKRQYDLLKKRTLYLTASITIFLVLSAVALYSAFYIAPFVTRGGGLEYSNEAGGILMGSMPPKGLLSFIYPLVTAKNDFDFWGTDFSMLNNYMGIVSIALLIFINTIRNIPREVRYYTLIGIFFLLLSMAEVFPFRKWLLILPFMDLFRFSSLFRLFYIFFFLLVSGHSLEMISNDLRVRSKFFYFVSGFAILLLAVNLSVLFRIEEWTLRTIFTKGWIYFMHNAGIFERIFLQGSIAVTFLLLLAVFIRQKRIGRLNFSYLTLLVLLFDLILSVQFNAYSTVISDYQPGSINNSFKTLPSKYPTPSLSVKSSDINDANLNLTIPYLWKNLAVYHKIPSSDGSSDYAFINQSNAIRKGYYDALIHNPLLFMATSVSEMNLVDTASIYNGPDGDIRFTEFHINGFQIELDIDAPGYLVCLQNYHPDWKVTDKHDELEVLRVNETFMAVKISEGHHTLRFRYFPKMVIILAWISMASWVAIILFLAFLSFRAGKKELPIISLAVLIVIPISILGIRICSNGNSREYDRINLKIKQVSVPNMQNKFQILNIDQSSEITNPGNNTSQISIDVKEDITDLIILLEQDNKTKLFYGHVNKIRYPIVDYIIEDYFPDRIESRHMGNPYWIAANREIGKEKQKQKQNIESFNGFEGDVPYWNLNIEAMDTSISFSGNTSFLLDSNVSFSSTYRNTLGELNKPPKKAVFISVAIKSEAKISAFIVFQVNRADETIEYISEGLEKFYMPDQSWYKSFLLAELDYKGLRPDDLISVYIWNPDRNTFRIDDFTVKSY